jgi:hypothetical protein
MKDIILFPIYLIVGLIACLFWKGFRDIVIEKVKEEW